MTMVEDRENAAEHKFEREQDLAFRIKAKMLGLWAAGHIGLIGTAAERYAVSVVDAEIAAHDDQALVDRIRDDLVTGGTPVPEQHIRRQLAVLGGRARARVLADASASGRA